MKKDDKNNLRRERFIMMSTSALVLTALTVTGVYMRNHTQRAQDNGYTIDFSALEDRADDKWNEISKSSGREQKKDSIPTEEITIPNLGASSDEVTIPGLTDGKNGGKTVGNTLEGRIPDQSESKGMSDGAQATQKNVQQYTGGKKEAEQSKSEQKQKTQSAVNEKAKQDENPQMEEKKETAQTFELENGESVIVETAGESPLIVEDLHFHPETMQKPVSGAPVIDYSMDHSVYFATLDQYKYNPAVIYGAQQGESVLACTAGRVINVHDDAELGHVLILDLGDGFQAIYGQLENIEVPIGATVEAGTKLATIAAPTIYYGKEGCNLYFQLKKDGESVNPGDYFQ